MKTLLLSLVAGLALVLASSTAEAGGGNGGGTKPNATVKVKNKTGSRLAVIVTNDEDVLADAQDLLANSPLSNSDLNKFKKLGGKLVNNGATGVFSVRAGDGFVVAAVEVSSSGEVGGDFSTEVGTIAKGDVRTITLED